MLLIIVIAINEAMNRWFLNLSWSLLEFFILCSCHVSMTLSYLFMYGFFHLFTNFIITNLSFMIKVSQSGAKSTALFKVHLSISWQAKVLILLLVLLMVWIFKATWWCVNHFWMEILEIQYWWRCYLLLSLNWLFTILLQLSCIISIFFEVSFLHPFFSLT